MMEIDFCPVDGAIISPHNRETRKRPAGVARFIRLQTPFYVLPRCNYTSFIGLGLGGGGMGRAYVAAPTPGREGGLGKHTTHRETSQPTHSEFTRQCAVNEHASVQSSITSKKRTHFPLRNPSPRTPSTFTFRLLVGERRGSEKASLSLSVRARRARQTALTSYFLGCRRGRARRPR